MTAEQAAAREPTQAERDAWRDWQATVPQWQRGFSDRAYSQNLGHPSRYECFLAGYRAGAQEAEQRYQDGVRRGNEIAARASEKALEPVIEAASQETEQRVVGEIVAWLRGMGYSREFCKGVAPMSDVANAIERGEYKRRGDPRER